MAPSADCAEASPFHCDSGCARTTAKAASLTAANLKDVLGLQLAVNLNHELIASPTLVFGELRRTPLAALREKCT
jgi:hypothetical protein